MISFKNFIENIKKTAVIIKGNPKYIKNNTQANYFYNQLEKILKKLGFEVSFDSGEPFSTPKEANVWIGHSRGADRLRFAPNTTITISIGSKLKDSINHPKDTNEIIPNKFHYILTDEMIEELKNKLNLDAIDNF